ncbi:hypothetical protein [Bifidobacterium cuniculi]|uniref:Uncharacterized protein n=1 Tax=Bifidobacterium cuniculi TaxID=1688 RepID=A0A087B4Y2_9BIFI|nr:hypothetical protein [Bifidobacterium cuniculi]KFI66082.1 hypothetical protein BCUN_0584 [Bifidobacterium cuniculi]
MSRTFMSPEAIDALRAKHRKPISTKSLRTERRFVNDLVKHPGQFAQFHKSYKMKQAAYSATSTIRARSRAAFRDCEAPGTFITKIVRIIGGYQLWVAYQPPQDTPDA